MNALVLSPNVEFLFADASDDFNERVAIAAAAGVRAIEFWGWRNKDVDGLERVLRADDVRVTAMVVDPIVSMVCEPEQFIAVIRETAAVAGRLGASTIIIASGARDEAASAAEQCDRAVAALRDALPFADEGGVALALEAVNAFDHPTAYVTRLHHALSLVDAVGSSALGIVVDFYHASRMNDLVTEIVGDRIGLIRHMQLAGLPNRDEPNVAGAAPYLDTVRTFRNGGYDGPIGLEYRPQLASASSWASVRAFLREQLEESAR
jgi:hydroxypyruvate isomerase